MNVLGLMVVLADDDPIKDKNFRALGDKELWEHATDSLLSLDSISKMVILTDAPCRFDDDFQDGELVYERSRPGLTVEEIPTGARLCRGEIEFQSNTTWALQALAYIAENSDYDAYALVNPCCPFIESRLIQMGLDAMGKREDVHRLYSVTRHSGQFESIKRETMGAILEVNQALTIYRRRALWPVEHLPDDTKDTIYKLGINRIQGLNIQDWPDWEIAEALMSQRRREGKRPD